MPALLQTAHFGLVVDDFAARAEGLHCVNQPRVHGVAVQRTAGVGEDVRKRGLRGFDRHVGQRRDGEIRDQGRRVLAAAKIGGDNPRPFSFPSLSVVREIVLLKNVVGGLEFANGVRTWNPGRR